MADVSVQHGTVDGTSLPAPSRKLVRVPKRLLALRTDDALVSRLRAGDHEVFEILYERHVPGLLAFCRHMLGSREEAEDAVQQAFASAYSDLLRSSREINFKPWLYTIARNRCVSAVRGRRDRPEAEVEVSTSGLSEEVERRAELRQMVSDIHDLPAEQRAALVLTELADLSQAEVADVLGCGVSNVKGLVFRARAGLTERREAREAPCEEIRLELASARRGGLRRGRLRHHLKGCSGCAAYLEDVRRQRKLLAVVLPVVPSLGLKETVLAATGIGSAGGAGVTGGGLALFGSGSTVAKLAVAGALAGGAGVAGPPAIERVIDGDEAAPAAEPARARPAATPAPPARPVSGAKGETPAGRARRVRRRGAGTPAENAPGRARAREVTGRAVPGVRSGGRPERSARISPPSRQPLVPSGQERERIAPPTARGQSLESPAFGVPKLK